MDKIERARNAISAERVIDLARAFCAVPTPGADEGRLAELVAEALEKPGIDLHVADVVAGRANVIAKVSGNGDRAPLVLQGHMDAGVHPGPWTHDPFRPWVDANRLYGGGVTDMKGALAAMVAAVEAAPNVAPLPGDLILHATMHHDGTGLGAKYALLTEGPHEGYAICGEPSSLAIHTSNGGAVKFEITLYGRTAHISRREEAVDALAPAADIYWAIREHDFDHEPHLRLPDLPRLVVGELHAGTAPAAVADHAVIRGDIRTVPGMDRTTVHRELQGIVNDLCPPDVNHRIRITALHQPFLGVTQGPLTDAITAVHTAIRGKTPRVSNELPGQAFVTDAADLTAAGLDTVVYGPADWHFAPDEYVEIDELVDSARIYLAVATALDT